MRRLRLMASMILVVAAFAAGGAGPPLAPPAAAQEKLQLAPAYEAQAVDSPVPVLAGRFGNGPFVNVGDTDGDGKDDLLVPQFLDDGRVFVISGATGGGRLTIPAPHPSTQGRQANFGQYVGKIEDIGGCPGGQPGVTCGTNPLPGPDGTPDLLVGATGVDSDEGVDTGAVYVLDGVTGAVMKRIDPPLADRQSEGAIAANLRTFSFGRSVLNPSSPYPSSAPITVTRGDVDLMGQPDIVIGNSTFYESGPSTNAACDPGPCSGSGRIYYYRGEDIIQSDPDDILDAPYKIIKNPFALTDDPISPTNHDSEFFGHSLSPVGDIGGCNIAIEPGQMCPRASSTNAGDGAPEVFTAAIRQDWNGFIDVGTAYLLDGKSGSILQMFEHPAPQNGVLFGFALGNQPALGDAGNTGSPDIFVPAHAQSADKAGQGRGWIMNGNIKTGPSTLMLSQLDDSTPGNGGNFGIVAAGVGDLAGDPRNEILVGAWGPGTPGTDDTVINDVHFFNPVTSEVLLTIEPPDPQPGASFGSGVAPLGDLNDDGYLDFAVGSGLYDGSTGINQGRVYIFRSTALPPPDSERTITLKLRRHLRAKGAISVADGGPGECIDGVPVTIRRDGSKVKSTTTDETGAYSVKLKDRQGLYRAIATAIELSDGSTCLKAKSTTVRHMH